MKLKKYQKEYDRYNKFTRKAYGILKNLYDAIENDEELNKKKDIERIVESLKYDKESYLDILYKIDNIDFTQVKDAIPKMPNNLLILPLYEDEDIYVNPNDNIGYIFNTTKD